MQTTALQNYQRTVVAESGQACFRQEVLCCTAAVERVAEHHDPLLPLCFPADDLRTG